MNERLRELAEQSYKEVIETNDYNGSAYTVREFDEEKFAELIVRECIDTLLWHGCDDAVPYIEWMAKNKLGVKE